MFTFSSQDVEQAVSSLCERLGIAVDTKVAQDYQNGKFPRLLSYEKLEKAELEIPPIQKYLIGATTFLNQPCHFYDLFRLCRHVIFLQCLSDALTTVVERACNYEPRLKRLCQARSYDSFEAIVYELVVAAKYCLLPDTPNVTFLPEETTDSPDLEVEGSSGKMFVECKRFDRSVDLSWGLRDIVRDKVHPAIDEFLKHRQSAVLEVSFHRDPNFVAVNKVIDFSLQSLRARTPIIDGDITVSVTPLEYRKLDEFTLYPSPKYYWERYGYRDKGEWFGLVSAINARFARPVSLVGLKGPLTSTWLDDVDWECVVKWKVTDENLVWRHKRLGYDRLFEGLGQLQRKGTNTILHVWFERDQSIGHRKNELLDFFARLTKHQQDIFGWIVFNETCLDVSLEGRFDLVEHAHVIQGPGAQNAPPVTLVFQSDDYTEKTVGEFGVGCDLPDVDSYFRSK